MAERDYEQLRAEMEKLRADVSSLNKAVHEVVSSWSADAKDAAKRSAAKVEAKAKESLDAVAHQVEERPITTLATAFGVGIVLGLILNRRS